MRHSLQTKILMLIGIIFIATMAVIIGITRRDVKGVIFNTEEKNIENIINIIHLNVEGKYRNLLLDKISFVRNRKDRLKSESAILIQSLNALLSGSVSAGTAMSSPASENNPSNMGETPAHGGAPATDMEKAARQKAAQWLSGLHLSFGVFLADADHDIFYHSSHLLEGKNLARITDVKARPISESINGPAPLFHKYVVFTCGRDQTRKLACLTRLGRGWVLGVAHEISEIEAQSRKKIDDIISILEENFTRIRIADTGSLCLFNAKGEMLIRPARAFSAMFTPAVLKALPASTKEDGVALFSLDQRRIRAYTSHIKALDWYITALVPMVEIQQRAGQVSTRLSVIDCRYFYCGAVGPAPCGAAVFQSIEVPGPSVAGCAPAGSDLLRLHFELEKGLLHGAKGRSGGSGSLFSLYV